ncbi:O-antigen ligase family protein [Flavobacterium sp.]|jgi:hypothetical protein|uniref:O-antigen ligase family protein n=1 Tax=Flavobacterium sp. TaxID=239 RepID=UPI0037BFE22C
MKINAEKFYTYIFIIVFLLQLYVSSFRINIFFQLFVLATFFFIEKVTISYKFYKILVPIIIIILIGFIGMIFNKYNLYNIIKDIFHFIRPLIAIFLGYLFYKRINNFRLFIKTIIIIGFISSLFHYYIIFFVNSGFSNVSSLRENSRDNVLELFALFFFSFYKKFQNEELFKNIFIKKIVYYSLLLSCVLYFSRTMILMSIVLLLTVYGYTILTKRALKIFSFLLIFLVGFYIFLFSINIQRNKKGIESFLYKVKVAPAEVFKTKIDREDHTDLWDHWRGYEAKCAFELLNNNKSGYIIGCGYGSLVNLKFFAPLSDDDKGMKYISELHNGYVFMLYKTGFFGLFLYLFFLYNLYKKIYYRRSFEKVFISGIALSIMLASIVIGSIFNGNPTMMILLGALVFFDEKNASELKFKKIK